ncbi:3-hydroxyacyl-CoA dehydrogenase family protein [Halospeciosus flavus]|uniref:3-hydroxyacyl-CoA dehydrogenase family protein n=1 Tax=Halospeciosus flavus TaxID=3032283 RepID=A0ABD5Z0K9_9EURY|nr:3-hydroxyacyl-CoA dehydrogenase family protein [Halospeciosus flavus]
MHVTVIGAGSMGHGIAQVSAQAGHTVSLNDVDEERVDAGLESIEANLQGGVDRGKVTPEERDATLERITGEPSLPEAVSDADLVVEAVPEDVDLKQSVFEQVEEHADEGTIVGTNTSSLSVTEIASALDDPSRAIGLHFFNPPHLMDLVEIVVAEQTVSDVEERAVEYVEGLDKEAVVVHDSAGFASSRLGLVLGLEAIRMVESGVASVEDIDTAMEEGYNHPMGPLELTDLVGLDVRLDIAEYLREELGERFRPPQLLKKKVRAGKLGKKSGEGFYVWEDGEAVRPSGEGE